jgi:myosin heavy subunit
MLNFLNSFRYNHEFKDIYTYVSPSLLVVNPFGAVPHLMTKEFLSECQEVRMN